MLSKLCNSAFGTVHTSDEDVGPRGSKAIGPEGRNLCQAVTFGSSDEIWSEATSPIWWYCQASMSLSRPNDFLTSDWAPSAPTKSWDSILSPLSNSITTGDIGTWRKLNFDGDFWSRRKLRPAANVEDLGSHSSSLELHISLPHCHPLGSPLNQADLQI